MTEEQSDKEKRIRALTRLYYSNPKVQSAMLDFAAFREISPRYFEGFGKRPDMIQYPSDIIGLVNKGATSFHCSEEIWNDPLQLSSEITKEEMDKLRKSWDLLIDIDSPYFDVSKEAAKLVIELLERYGIKYGLKYSGSKGFHIIVTGKAFPESYNGQLMKNSFPEWPRAITEFIFKEIKPEFRKRVGQLMSFSHLEKNDKEKTVRVVCKRCNNIALKGTLTKLMCPVCNMHMERRDMKSINRRLRCLSSDCAGVLEVLESIEYFYCENCNDVDNEKLPLSSNKHPEMFEEIRGELADEHAELDLILVAPRHLFRMPYSLHEKTSLCSTVIKKEELQEFSPKDADPMKIKFLNYMPENNMGEAEKLLSDAMKWKASKETEEERLLKEKFSNFAQKKGDRKYDEIEFKDINDSMYPASIKKLLKGVNDGKKRGLFILITFFRAINMGFDEINLRVREWNKLNENPLKEGYIKSQISWHMKQKKKILPPNYENEAFYKDLGLIDKKMDVKNPIVEVMRNMRKNK